MRIALAACCWYMSAAACCVFPCAIVLASSGCSAMCDCADSAPMRTSVSAWIAANEARWALSLCIRSIRSWWFSLSFIIMPRTVWLSRPPEDPRPRGVLLPLNMPLSLMKPPSESAAAAFAAPVSNVTVWC